MKETFINLNKYGFNAVTNMILIAKYLSYGGPIIIKDKGYDKPEVVFFDKTGDPCYWIFGDRYIDIDTALIRLFRLIEETNIESFTFFVEDLYCMFKSSQIGRKHYIRETYEDSELNINLRHHVTLSRVEFIRAIVNTENHNIGDLDEVITLLNIDKLAFMESMDEVNKMLDKI